MKNSASSTKLYFSLVSILSLSSALYLFIPHNLALGNASSQTLPVSKPLISLITFFVTFFLYGGLGYIGIILSKKIGFPDIWDDKVKKGKMFFNSTLCGIAIGISICLIDLIFTPLTGKLPHPPFPTSILASITASIGEEIIYRLFFVTFWVWLISYIFFKRKWLKKTFWAVTFASAIAFTFAHLPAIMLLFNFKTLSSIPIELIVELFAINGSVSFLSAYYLKKYGFLGSVNVHFFTDLIWHVLWPFIF